MRCSAQMFCECKTAGFYGSIGNEKSAITAKPEHMGSKRSADHQVKRSATVLDRIILTPLLRGCRPEKQIPIIKSKFLSFHSFPEEPVEFAAILIQS